MFRQKGQLVRALYYTALAEEQEYSSIRPLIDWLDYNGFSMVTKPTKSSLTPRAVGKSKATWTSSWPSMRCVSPTISITS